MRYSNHRLSSSPQPVRLAYIKGGAPSGSAGKGQEQAPAQPPDPPKSSDEFALLARWDRSPESLLFHAETLISWAPVEILSMPAPMEDETGTRWMMCRFRYFGPYGERDILIGSVRAVLDQLTVWEDVIHPAR